MKPVTVLIVEDHFLMRIALHGLIDTMPGYQIVGEATSGQDAIALYRELQPEIVIMDLRLNGVSGFEAMDSIVKRYPKAKILALSTLQGSEDIHRAIECGARGYLTKGADGQELSKAIQTLLAGGYFVPPALQARLDERLPGNSVTPREKMILDLLSRGCGTSDIAINLQIAEKTVRIHIGNILEKLGAHDRAQALMIALERGIIHLDS